MVEDHRNMGRRIGTFVVLDLLEQHVAKPRDRTDGQPVGFARQRRQRVVGAKDKGGAIDQVEVTAFAKIASAHGV